MGTRFGPMLAAVVLAVAWFVLGGLPFADHDEYGSVPISSGGDTPLPTRLALPGGKVYLYFEESGLSDSDSPDQPEDLVVAVRPAGAGKGAASLEIEDVPGFLFSSKVDDTGWEPYGKLDADQGEYWFDATASSSFGRVTIGNPPINPFGPPIVGSILILLAGAGLTYLIYLRSQG